MSRCTECGEDQPRSEMEIIARYAMEGMFHATRGNRLACIENLEKAIEIAIAFHAKCEGVTVEEVKMRKEKKRLSF